MGWVGEEWGREARENITRKGREKGWKDDWRQYDERGKIERREVGWAGKNRGRRAGESITRDCRSERKTRNDRVREERSKRIEGWKEGVTSRSTNKKHHRRAN